MNKPIAVLTKEGYAKLEAELEELKTVRRADVAEKIKIARSFGDLSENSEYDEAKNEQGLLESRIAEIQAILAHAQIIDSDEISTEKAGLGTTVKILDVEMEEEMEFHIVSTKEADLDKGKLSDESPIGAALVGRKVGETVDVETPSGMVQLKILEISKSNEEAEG